MRKNLMVPVVALVAAVALVLGTFGQANAAALTAKSVKKIAAKVVDAKAPSLSVAKAKTADSATTAAGVADNAITGAKIANGSITKDDLAAGAAPTVLIAQVASAGTLTFGSTGVSATRTDVGRYDVTFPRAVDKCAVVAQAVQVQQSDIIIVTQTAGGVVTIDAEDPDQEDTQRDTPFNIIVAC